MNFKKPKLFFVLFNMLFFPFCFQSSYAESKDVVGVIANVIGNVHILHGNNSIKAEKEFPLYEMDIIVTGESSAVKINFKDGSNFMGFQNTRFKISEYKLLTNKSDGINLKSAIDIIKGKVRFFVKPKDEGMNNAKITTPNAVMLIRGTSGGVATNCKNANKDECSCTVGDEGSYDIFNPADSTHHEVITRNLYSEVCDNKPPTVPVQNLSALDFYNQNAKMLDVNFKQEEVSSPTPKAPSSDTQQKNEDTKPAMVIGADGSSMAGQNNGNILGNQSAAAVAAAAASQAAAATAAAAVNTATAAAVNAKKNVNVQFIPPSYP